MSNYTEEQLPALLALAHNRTIEGRLLLAEKLAGVFLSQSSALSEHEEKLVTDLINDLLLNDDPLVREKLVTSFTAAMNAPRDVAIRLAAAPIEIAAPLLTNNDNLTDTDLIVVIDKSERDYAQAIAHRKEISEAVADALVETGDIRVMQTVAENMGAKLSGKAIEVMVDAARLAAMLQKPILGRPEIKGDTAIRLYWWLSHDLRRATLERFGFGSGKLDAALRKAIDERLGFYALQKDDDNTMEDMADWLQERDTLTPAILPQLLRAGYYKLFTIVLARLCKLDTSLTDMIAAASEGRGIIALCRSLNIDKGSFISIFLMARGARADEQIVHPRELSNALAAFDKLTPNKAQAILESWRQAPDTIFPATTKSEAEGKSL